MMRWAQDIGRSSLPNRLGQLLILEDNLSLRTMMHWDFDALGYQVTVACYCREVRALLGSGFEFDFALLDYHLPDGNSILLVPRLRGQHPGAKVVVCSGMTSPSMAREARAAGVSRLYCKPVDVSRIHDYFTLQPETDPGQGG